MEALAAPIPGQRPRAWTGAGSGLTPLPLFLQFLVALEGSFNGSDLAGFLGPAERLAAEAEVASVSSSRALRGEETVLTLAREAAARIPSDPSLFTDDNRQALADLLRIGQGQIATALEAAREHGCTAPARNSL